MVASSTKGCAEDIRSQEGAENAWLIYDGDCPLCSSFSEFIHLRTNLPGLKLINARDGGTIVGSIRDLGCKLDSGMVPGIGNNFYHGADCIHVLAILNRQNDFLSSIFYSIFSSYLLSKLLYPFFKLCRILLLKILGRKRLPY